MHEVRDAKKKCPARWCVRLGGALRYKVSLIKVIDIIIYNTILSYYLLYKYKLYANNL